MCVKDGYFCISIRICSQTLAPLPQAGMFQKECVERVGEHERSRSGICSLCNLYTIEASKNQGDTVVLSPILHHLSIALLGAHIHLFFKQYLVCCGASIFYNSISSHVNRTSFLIYFLTVFVAKLYWDMAQRLPGSHQTTGVMLAVCFWVPNNSSVQILQGLLSVVVAQINLKCLNGTESFKKE